MQALGPNPCSTLVSCQRACAAGQLVFKRLQAWQDPGLVGILQGPMGFLGAAVGLNVLRWGSGVECTFVASILGTS